MTIAELIAELEEYPGYFRVQIDVDYDHEKVEIYNLELDEDEDGPVVYLQG